MDVNIQAWRAKAGPAAPAVTMAMAIGGSFFTWGPVPAPAPVPGAVPEASRCYKAPPAAPEPTPVPESAPINESARVNESACDNESACANESAPAPESAPETEPVSTPSPQQSCRDSRESKKQVEKPLCTSCEPPSCVQSEEQVSSKMSKSSKNAKRKRYKCKKLKNASISALGKNAQNNCCACCGVLMDYFKEVMNLIINRGCPDGEPKIADLLKELMQVAGCICQDCIGVLKIIFRFLVVYKK